MKKHSLFFILILIFFVLNFSSCSLIQKRQKKKITNLEEMISELQSETIPLKFKVQKNSNNEIELIIFFLDLNGNIIRQEPITIQGKELHFDFQVIELHNNTKAKKSEQIISKQYLFYPYKIYTDIIPPIDGIKLCPYYQENGFPAIYKGFESYLSDKNMKFKNAYEQKMTQTFEYVLNEDLENLTNQFGNAVHDMKEISSFKKGYTYSLVCKTHTGSIEPRGE